MKRPRSMPMERAIEAVKNRVRGARIGNIYGRWSLHPKDPEFDAACGYKWALGEALRALYDADSRYECPLDVLERLHEKYDRWAHNGTKNAEDFAYALAAIDDLIDMLLS